MNDSVTVVTSTKNRRCLLSRTLCSVLRQDAVTSVNIVDDGSDKENTLSRTTWIHVCRSSAMDRPGSPVGPATRDSTASPPRGFDPQLSNLADWDMVIRLARRGEPVTVMDAGRCAPSAERSSPAVWS